MIECHLSDQIPAGKSVLLRVSLNLGSYPLKSLNFYNLDASQTWTTDSTTLNVVGSPPLLHSLDVRVMPAFEVSRMQRYAPEPNQLTWRVTGPLMPFQGFLIQIKPVH